jgi:hypothetical protein
MPATQSADRGVIVAARREFWVTDGERLRSIPLISRKKPTMIRLRLAVECAFCDGASLDSHQGTPVSRSDNGAKGLMRGS